MATILFTHESCVNHNPGPMHPESPARLRAVHAALADEKYANLERREAPIAEVEQIARIHPAAYVEKVLEAIPSEGQVMLDGDTHVSPGSDEAARRAVGRSGRKGRRPWRAGTKVGVKTGSNSARTASGQERRRSEMQDPTNGRTPDGRCWVDGVVRSVCGTVSWQWAGSVEGVKASVERVAGFVDGALAMVRRLVGRPIGQPVGRPPPKEGSPSANDLEQSF